MAAESKEQESHKPASASRYSVLIIEQKSLAHETSRKLSKLIHGGIRYLETAQFKLVLECLSERRRLLKLAPDLVRLEPFIIPIYKSNRRKSWEIFAGSHYDLRRKANGI